MKKSEKNPAIFNETLTKTVYNDVAVTPRRAGDESGETCFSVENGFTSRTNEANNGAL